MSLDFKTVGAVMALGDFFTETPKENADWKLRMLKAGLPAGALIMPANWDELPEAEKLDRLDKITKMFNDKEVENA